MKENSSNTFQRGLLYIAAGTELAAAVTGGALLGYFLDKKWGTEGLCIGIFILIGFTAGVYNLLIILRKAGKTK